jgi:hypothetical protein
LKNDAGEAKRAFNKPKKFEREGVLWVVLWSSSVILQAGNVAPVTRKSEKTKFSMLLTRMICIA